MTTLRRKLFLAGLLGSVVLMPGFATRAAAQPEIAGACAPTAIKYKVADRTASTTSERFVPLGGANINFTQAGPASSCVVVSFTGDARSEIPGTLVDVRIYLDGALCGRGTLVAIQTDFVTTTINAICPDAQPGARRIEVKFRARGDGIVKLSNYTTIVHYRQ